MTKVHKSDKKKRLKQFIFSNCPEINCTSRTELNDANIFERKHFILIVTIFRILRLWPYSKPNQSSLSRLLPRILFYTSTVTIVIPQILRAIGGDYDVYDGIITFTTIFFHIISVIKYTTILSNRLTVKRLFDDILHDWQTMTDEKERTILVDVANKDSFYRKSYIGVSGVGLAAFVFLQLVPIVAETFFGIQNDKLRALLNPGNYVVDMGKAEDFIRYFHYIITASVNLGVIVMADIFLLMCATHISGLFDILCYKLNQCGSIMGAKDKPTISNDYNFLLNEFRHLVIFHTDILMNVTRMENMMTYSVLIVEILSLAMLPIGLFGCRANAKYPILTAQAVFYLVGFTFELFFLNSVGQRIIDQSEKVFYSVYCNEWYNLPVECQRFVELIMVRSLHTSKLTAGKLSILSLPAFLSIMKTIFSFYTVLVSVF